jgi:hypothetical protein
MGGGMTEEEKTDKKQEMPEASFSSLVLFLTTIASQHLGLVQNPLSDKVEKNLELSKYTIDSLDVLKEKTKNNLTKEEEGLLEGMLSNLKLSYVKEQSGKDNSADPQGAKS